ncbi:hypothetical protein CCH79_00017464 [Gambusia affinis]|uniref:Uncharacterized protein n=1 Tax=Gambusia affinis TaxID=33528 RepID=A0A315UZS3_GAMAF|nr:hypothetical protein CCH79_00017464 [Gambusia affinis]
MEPDPDGPFQRVERTLVSVWCYITEAVGRFLRPQPAEATDNDPTFSDGPGVDGEPADGSQIDDDARGVEVGEEPSLSTVSLASLSSPVVAWERCTADIDLKPKEEDHENKEELIEEQLGQTGNDFAGQLVTESVKVHQGSQEKTDTEKCDTCEESLAPENDGQLATGHGWVKEGVFEDMDSREIRSCDHQKVLETSADIQEEAEENSEESNEKTGDPKVNKSSAAMLGDANIGEDASQLSSGNQNFPDEKTKDVETQLRQLSEDENVQMSLFEEATTPEESEQVKSGQTTEDILTQSGTSSKDVQKTEPDTTEFTIREEDMQLTIMQTAKEDVTVEEMSADLDYEMAEGKNLSAEHENSAEQTQREETQQLVCKELSGVAEDERVEEEKDNMSATHEESEDRKSSRGDEDVQQEENVLAQSVTSSKDDQEQFNLKGNDSAEQLINKNMTEHQLGLEKKLHTSAETEEVIENKEENTTNEANYEELEKRGDGDVGEESVSRKREEEVAKVVEVKEELEEESDEIQTDDREKNEEEFEEESEAEQFTTDGETGEQREGENTAASQQTEESEKEKSRRTNEEENISTQSVTSIEINQRTEEEQFSQRGNDSGDQLIPEDMTTNQLGLEKTEIQNLHTCKEIEKVENTGFLEERGEIQEDNRDEDFVIKQHIMKEEREEQKEGEAGPVMLGDANICEDASQLKSENENSAERTEQVETQQLVCEELSGVVDDERVEEEESVSCEEAEQDKGSGEVEDVRQEKNIVKLSPTSSEGDQDTGEEQFNQTDSDRSFDENKEDWEEECREIQEDDAEETERDFEEKSEVPGNDEEEATVGSEHVQLKERVTDGTESSEEEEHLRLDDRWKVLETLADILEDDEEEAEEDSEEESKMQETTPTKEEEGSNEKTEGERDNKASAAILEDASLLNFSDEKTKVETLLPVCRDAVTDINLQMTDFGDEDLNQTTDEELEEDKNRRTIEEEKIEFTFKEDDVTSMETATEKEMTVEEVLSDVEERLSDKEICMKRVCTTAPVTVKAGGVSEQEINIGFSDIPLGVIEGQAGLSHELNTKACEETPEAVPEHNNELESDQNTTQRFFEGGNSEEIQTIHLPEEVEVFKSTEAGGGEYLLIKEGSTEESKELQVGTLQFAEDTEKPKSDNINLVLDHFSEEEKVELLDTSMKTEIKQSDEEFETELEDEDETDELETNRLPQDVCEKRNAVAADEGVDSADETPEFPKSEEGKMAQISFGPELLQAFRLEDDREIKPTFFDESATELPHTEEQEYVDEGQPEHEVLDLNEIATLHLVRTASDLITGQSALSHCQISTDTETADESKTTLAEITNEPQQTEKCSKDPAEEHQDGIDEEILDLWIETAMSKDTGGIKEDQLKEEPGETSSEEKKEGVKEAISEETETSLITLDSGFLDQTFSETQIIKSGDSVVFADKKDNSEDICEVPTSNSESALMEEMIETLQPYRIAEGASGEIGSCPDSGVSSPEPKHPNQEGGTTEKKQDETKPETDAVSGDDEEADVTSLTEATESDISSEIQISPLLEEESVLTEPPSGGEPQNEPEKRNFSLDAPEEKPSQDLSGSFPAPSRTELEEDWSEVLFQTNQNNIRSLKCTAKTQNLTK